MANVRDTITLALNLDKHGFTSGLKSMVSDVRNADGVFGKLKAGVTGLGSSFKAAASNPAVMATAITAAGTAMIKVAGDASELGVEIGKLTDATGLSAEGASRLAEVAGDIGISTGTLTSSIGRMNKAIASSPDLFADLGIEIARTESGAADVDATFLNAVDAINAIKNPTDKAAAAAKVFGKGWQEMAELIGQGAETIKTNMAGVDDSKVFDEKAVAEAREYRDAMDQLGDDFGQIALQVGRGLVPVLKTAADLVDKIFEAGDKLPDLHIANPFDDFDKDDPLDYFAIKDDVTADIKGVEKATDQLAGSMHHAGEAAREGSEQMVDWNRHVHGAGEAARDGTGPVEDYMGAVHGAGEAARESAAKTDELTGAVNKVEAAYTALFDSLDVEQGWADVNHAIEDFVTTMGDAEASTDDQAEALRDAIRTTAEFVQGLEDVPPEVESEIVAALNRKDLDEAIRLIDELTKTRTLHVKIVAGTGGAGSSGLTGSGVVLPDTGALPGHGFAGPGRGSTRGDSAGDRQGLTVWEHGEWVEQAEEAADAAVDAEEQSAEELSRIEDEQMARKKEMGLISAEVYEEYVRRKLQAENDAGRITTDYAYELWRTVKGLEEDKAAVAEQAAEDALDAVKAAEEAKRAEYEKTVKAWQDAVAKVFAMQKAGADLTVAIQEQAQAIAELQYVQAAAAQGDEAAIKALSGFTKNAAEETFEGAEAQAAARGLVPGTPEYAAFIQNEIASYLAGPGAALGGEFAAILQQLAAQLPTAGQFAGLPQPPVNVTLQIDGQTLANVLTAPITANQQRRTAGAT